MSEQNTTFSARALGVLSRGETLVGLCWGVVRVA